MLSNSRTNNSVNHNGQVVPPGNTLAQEEIIATKFIESLGERFGLNNNLVEFLIQSMRKVKERGSFSLEDFANNPILNDKAILTQAIAVLSQGATEFLRRAEEGIKNSKNSRGLKLADEDTNTATAFIQSEKGLRVALLRVESMQFSTVGHIVNHSA